MNVMDVRVQLTIAYPEISVLCVQPAKNLDGQIIVGTNNAAAIYSFDGDVRLMRSFPMTRDVWSVCSLEASIGCSTRDGRLWRCDLRTKKKIELAKFPIGANDLHTPASQPHQIVVALADSSVLLYDVRMARQMHSFRAARTFARNHTTCVFCHAHAPSDPTLVIGEESKLNFYSTQTGQLLAVKAASSPECLVFANEDEDDDSGVLLHSECNSLVFWKMRNFDAE
eukprot:c19741_g1_i9.p1 GENE.c19741_g1_i9~~c19741_g1_i9.p1  ORF type:complete len:226 (-),score=54.58 c19741_g1_i9:26-703(-)